MLCITDLGNTIYCIEIDEDGNFTCRELRNKTAEIKNVDFGELLRQLTIKDKKTQNEIKKAVLNWEFFKTAIQTYNGDTSFFDNTEFILSESVEGIEGFNARFYETNRRLLQTTDKRD